MNKVNPVSLSLAGVNLFNYYTLYLVEYYASGRI